MCLVQENVDIWLLTCLSVTALKKNSNLNLVFSKQSYVTISVGKYCSGPLKDS